MKNLSAFARGWRVNLIDYERETSGLLVSSGCGCMMAVMDACPVFRWCLDIDSLKPESKLGDFLLAAERYVSPLGVVGWFSITDPEPLRAALRPLRTLGRVMAYTQGARMPCGYEFSTMEDFISAANQPRTSLISLEAARILEGARYAA